MRVERFGALSSEKNSVRQSCPSILEGGLCGSVMIHSKELMFLVLGFGHQAKAGLSTDESRTFTHIQALVGP